MVSHLFYYQLALLALVGLFVMLHVAESQAEGLRYHRQRRPSSPKVTIQRAETLSRLDEKASLCPVCTRDRATQSAPPIPPDP